MNSTLNILQGELERLFTMNELMEMCRNLLGMEPDDLGGASTGKAAFVRRLVERCEGDNAIIALTDAVMMTKTGMVDPRLKQVYSAPVDETLEEGARVGGYEVVERAGEFSLGDVYWVRRARDERAGEPSADEGSADGDGEGSETEADGAGATEEGESKDEAPASDKAKDEAPASEKRYRLEVVSGALTPDVRAVQRYLTTLRASRRVEHPSIPTYLEVGCLDDGRPWAVSEIPAEARQLSEILDGKPRTLLEGWPVLEQVIEGLAALHSNGMAHGDVKLENVLVLEREPEEDDAEAPEPWVWLVGLGSDRLFSRPTRDDRATGPLLGAGTPKCMAPEQARGKPTDRRTDLYGLGALLYELLTGRTVFTGRTGIDLVAKALTEEPKPPSAHAPKGAVNDDLDALVLKLLAKDALRRPADIPAFRKTLETIIDEARAAAEEPEGTIEDAQAAADEFLEAPEEAERADMLEEACRAARAWDVAVEAFEMALETTEDEELHRAIKLRLARVAAEETKEPERAEEIYKELLEKAPDDDEVVAALEALYRRTGSWAPLVEMLLARAEKQDDAAEKAATLRDVARIYERETGQPEDALTVLLAVLGMVQDEELLDDIGRLAGETGRWNDVVQTCSTVVQSLQEPPKVVLITTRMGRWYGEQLGRLDYALPCYQQALAIDPTNDDALRGMEEIFRRQQQWLELSQVLLTRAEAAQYPADKRDRLAEAAEIFANRLSDQGRATEIYRQILADDPAHLQSVEALERIYVRTEDWAALIRLYEAKDEALTDASEKAETRYFLGEVYEDRLGNDQAATEAYRKVLELAPSHVPALKGLERLYAKTGAFRELLDILAAQLEMAKTPRQRVLLHERRGQILEEEFVERKEALAEYGELLAIEPDNENGLTAVARLQRALERWEALDVTWARHAEVTDDKERKAQLLRDRARLLVERLEDPARAAEVLTELSMLLPKDTEVLEDLARQRLAADDAEGAVEALRRLAEATEDAEKRATVWVRVGELQERKLEDHDAAEEAYRKALDADKNNAIAAAALQERYAERGDMTAALDMLERQLEAASGDLERARIYTEMGNVCRLKLDQPERAVGYYEKALELDKSNAAAAEPLAEIHRAAGRWDQAVEIYDRFSDATEAMPTEKKLEFFRAWGEASMKVGDLAKAEKAFSSAVEVDDGHADVAIRLGDVHFDAEAWEKAAAQYERALDKFGDELEPPRRAEVLLRCGIAFEKSESFEKAGQALDAALELIPTQTEALRHRADVHIALKELEPAAEMLQRLADALDDDEIRVKTLTELGDLYANELVEHEKAAAAYSAALSLEPDNRNLLMRQMKAYSNTKQWNHLVEVVLKIADMETEPVKMARYYQTAAMIAHHELGRAEEAREYYETALEADPSLQKSFEALAELLTEAEEWEELVESHKSYLERLPADAPKELKIKIYDALGGVLQNKLDRPDEAIVYLEKAQELDPENRPRKETLARLYGSNPAMAAKAIPLHHQLLALNPFRAESYRALYDIYAASSQWDEQWCCARTLVGLRMAEEEEEAFYKTYKQDEIPAPGDCLTEEQWQNYLLSKQQDRNITAIFETIMPAVLAAQSRPHGAFSLDPSSARDLDADDHPFCGLVKFAAATLGVRPPQVFFAEGSQESALIIQTNPPALLAGDIALSAAYQNPRALAFVVGRQLAYSRGGNLMRVYIESGTMMSAWLLAALKHVQPQLPIPPDLAGTVGACGGKLTAGLGPVENEALRTQVLSFIDSAAKVDLKQWATAVDYTADRTGFLLCDDLDIASQLIRLEQGSPTPPKDRLKELNLFSVSPEYFALRQKLMIQAVASE